MISIVAAIGKNRELGYKNDLIWKIKKDLKHFKDLTTNHKIVMGKNTYYSLPKKLENREYIVLTDEFIDGVECIFSIEEFKEKYLNTQEEIFIIGGASIYSQFISLADNLYLTEIEDTTDLVDVYFPVFEKKLYVKTIIEQNEENDLKFDFVLYKKLSK